VKRIAPTGVSIGKGNVERMIAASGDRLLVIKIFTALDVPCQPRESESVGVFPATISAQPRFAKMFVEYLEAHNSWVEKAC
jgi:hypothetical protein